MLSVEEVRLVSCPACGAGSTDKCYWPGANDASNLRRKEQNHESRYAKAVDYRAEHRI
jgi:hypothetical protein